VDITDRRYFDDIRHARRDKELKKYAKKRKLPPAAPLRVPSSGARPGVVGAIHYGGCVVHVGGELRDVRPFPGVAVGDEVEVAEDQITAVALRRTTLSRPDPTDERAERVLAANIDTVVIVSSVGAPPFRPGLIERVLVAVERGGAVPVVCLNKIELRSEADDLSLLDGIREAGVRIINTSCATGEGIIELQAAIRARTCVFTGHSGVGKSSLINALFPALNYATGDLGKKGRHTTTSSCLYEDGDGTRIIDTPGIRQFGLWRVSPRELRGYFPEFVDLATGCRFGDCTHTHEPQCAVRDAQPARYPRYLRLLGSLAAE
jgi:ribosome biogenesis GTPase / thiamine phosphate phosphatase